MLINILEEKKEAVKLAEERLVNGSPADAHQNLKDLLDAERKLY